MALAQGDVSRQSTGLAIGSEDDKFHIYSN
jgi:hypothetical protein